MSVKAKFYIKSISAYAVGNGSVALAPATRGAENASWAAATPSGSIEMTINNTSAWDWFRDNLGREVYIDFTLAPDFTDPKSHEFVLFDQPDHYNNGRCLHCSLGEDVHTVEAT